MKTKYSYDPAPKIAAGIISLIPWKLRFAFYRSPFFNRWIRTLLNKIFSRDDHPVYRITAGPLRGFSLKMDIRRDKSFWLATHEPLVQITLTRLVRPGWTAYDIGAYIGYYTLLLSSLCGPEGRVYAFEPHPKNFRLLEENIDSNRLSNVRPRQIAIFSRSGSGYLAGISNPAESRLEERPFSDSAEKESGRVEPVELITMDEFVFSGEDRRPDLIKIDVEGSELRVLSGMKRTLTEYAPIVICEIHSRKLESGIRDFFSSGDYDVRRLEASAPKIFQPVEETPGHLIAAAPQKRVI